MTTVKLLKAYWGVLTSSGPTQYHPKGEILTGLISKSGKFIADNESTLLDQSFFEILGETPAEKETWLPSPPPEPGVYLTRRVENSAGDFYSYWNGHKWGGLSIGDKERAERVKDLTAKYQDRLYLADAHSIAPTIPTKKGKSLADEIMGLFSFLEG